MSKHDSRFHVKRSGAHLLLVRMIYLGPISETERILVCELPCGDISNISSQPRPNLIREQRKEKQKSKRPLCKKFQKSQVNHTRTIKTLFGFECLTPVNKICFSSIAFAESRGFCVSISSIEFHVVSLCSFLKLYLLMKETHHYTPIIFTQFLVIQLVPRYV